MRLTSKMVLAFVAVLALVLTSAAWLRYEDEVATYEADMRHDGRVVAMILAHDVAVTWRMDDRAAALTLLDDPVLSTEAFGATFEPLAAAPGALRGLRPGQVGEAVVGDRLETWAPVDQPGLLDDGAVVLRQSLADQRAHAAASLRTNLLTAGLLAGISVGATALLGAVFVGRPTRRLVDKVRRIGDGDLTGPLALRQRDELGEIAREIDAMCERLAAARDRIATETAARVEATHQLRHADRLATIGTLASGVAHELATPLNVVAGRAQMIQLGEVHGADLERSAASIVTQTRRMTTLIRRLLDFARRSELRRGPADLREPVERAAGMLDELARTSHVVVAIAPGDAVPADVDPGAIEQVVTNLVVNAIHATPPGGRVDVAVGAAEATAPGEAAPRRWATIEVADTGRGIPEAHRQRIFEPFFTTKDVGEGTGLGLSVVWGIVADHGGWIDLRSELGRGTTFTVHLPPAAAPAAA